MKILSWNCQGLDNPWTVNALREGCWREMPNIIFVMETMIDANRLEQVHNICDFTDGVCLSSNRNSSGMRFWWRDINIIKRSFSTHHFSADILDNDDCPVWRAIGIYGWPEQENKHLTWNLMSRLKYENSLPCVMFGDFNEVLSNDEIEGANPRTERCLDAFRSTLDECTVKDWGYKGSKFTWKRGRTIQTFIRERLDRFLADPEWCAMLPKHEIQHFIIYRSNHAPIMLTASNYYERGRTYFFFKFEAFGYQNKNVKKLWLICGHIMWERGLLLGYQHVQKHWKHGLQKSLEILKIKSRKNRRP